MARIIIATSANQLEIMTIETTTNQTKPAAIWARVSTKDQKEISPDTQITRCRELLKSKDYIATKIFSVDYCSLDLYTCREFQQLRDLIHNRQIMALAIYDRDRLEAKGLQRLMFLAELKEAGVELLLCNGSPIIDGPEGQIVELALAIGKERQVLRTRTGARDGLHDRVTLKKKPANHHRVFGFDWEKEHERLVPNVDYENMKLIFDLALGGEGYAKIQKDLGTRGIASPKGSTWSKGQISNIIHNPVYAGRYAALKTSVVRSDQPGFKVRQVPEAQWIYLSEVEVVNPPITWEDRTAILEQIQRHIKLSKRHAKHDYLLRGMIECEEHVGKKGNHIKFHGRPLHGAYGYVCPGDGGQHNYIKCDPLENAVKNVLRSLFEIPNSQLWQRISGLEEINRPQLDVELKKQKAKLSKSILNEAMLEERYIRGNISPEAYELLSVKFHAQRKALETGIMETQQQIASTEQIEEKVKSLKDIRDKFLANTKGFTDQQWRELLESLDCRIQIITTVDLNTITPDVKMRFWGKFLGKNKHHDDTVCPLEKFNAVMFIKAPYSWNPQKIKDIGLPNPH